MHVLGSDEPLTLGYASILKIISKLEITPNLFDLKKIEQGRYMLSRIDINYSFEFIAGLCCVTSWPRATEYSSKTSLWLALRVATVFNMQGSEYYFL